MGAADDTSELCSSIEGTGLAKQYAVNSHDSTVGVIIDNHDDEMAKNICVDIANQMTQSTAHFQVKYFPVS
jgi:hypothetical protein